MKSKSFYTILSAAIILFSALYFVLFQKQTISREDVQSVEVKSETIESGIELELETKEAQLFTSQIKYPFTKIEAIDVPIKQWIVEQENAFYDELEQISFIFPKKIAAHFSIDTEITKVNDSIFSFQLNQEQHLEDDNYYAIVKTFVIDLKNERIIDINDVIDINDENKKRLHNYLKENRKQNNLTVTQIDNKIKSLSDSNWLLTKDELILLFNDQTADLKQINKIKMPYKEIKQILTKDYRALFVSEPKKTKKEAKKETDKLIALTFDDGPNDTTTPKILKTLEKYDVKATFFMLSSSAKKYPKIAKLVAEQGHEVANHTINHPNLNLVKKSRIEREIIESQKVIEEITGVKPSLFRPPYGEYNKTVIKVAEKSDQTIILWSVDSYDWKSKNKKKIINQIKKQKTPRSIILMHDIHETTADSVEGIIKHLQKSGYEFVTVSELLPHLEPNKNGVYYGKAKK